MRPNYLTASSFRIILALPRGASACILRAGGPLVTRTMQRGETAMPSASNDRLRKGNSAWSRSAVVLRRRGAIQAIGTLSPLSAMGIGQFGPTRA